MASNERDGDASLAISHLDDTAFVPQGLRSHNVYRDLGVASVTGRKIKAHVVRAAQRPDKASLGGRHKHILAHRHEVYTEARARQPRRWSGATRNWQPVGSVSIHTPRPGRSRQAGDTRHDSQRRPLAA